MGRKLGGSESPERAKKVAIREFVKHIVAQLKSRRGDAPVSVGFSDDDPHNVQAVERYLRRGLGRMFPDFRFVVYDTSDRNLRGGRKILISTTRTARPPVRSRRQS